ncbi:MAG: hypothetical protein COU42_03205 [Candidatus Nealsonbacteria bacterium CG10_big_fil_rev_8_21_14_0_10_36_24]|uniref:Uncharacterized protein n=2 Tax=Candidatus Nealsoniibacteriota TaxID=1817911 RepID=A0A2H0YN58_9BACT|nr:MAG: hypothetical protein COU42_03205 [Candidatus Nealsonbacteria bacterium CG10_big_fil_rev_8_21_14_0_10_36_24]PIS39937.1 MAG: hypothetical protein COT32_02430 [Candidatus Nealsonbacteria bacterium CG08_land_8_20_14_0_20_36_22]
MEKVVTIPRELAENGKLVIIPHEEYEEFLHWKRTVKTYKSTAAEKKALKKARRDFARGEYLTLKELEK